MSLIIAEGERKKEEARREKEEGRSKKGEGRKLRVCAINIVLTANRVAR
ncbi:MAG: hypothetical protein ACRCT1_23570 [Microcoleaceae cyanobacterium]